MDFKEIISIQLSKISGIDKNIIDNIIEIPPDGKLGDFAVPCFLMAKSMKKSPQNIALEFKDQLTEINLKENHKHFELIENNGPYLNFFVNKVAFAKNILQQIYTEKSEYGKGKKKNEKVMIEFAQVNTHKEFHVGHLRCASLGDSLVRIYRFNGYDVVSANYPGDSGTHVAKTLWCYLKYHKNDTVPKNKGAYLGKIYSEAARRYEEEPEAKEEVSQILQKLEHEDPEIHKLWVETRKWSLEQFDEVFGELDIIFDVFFFESDVEKEGKKIVDELTKKGLAIKDQGAILVDLKEFNLDVLLILKSDGTSLYATKDLALAERKFKEFNIDKSYYIVDNRQSMYFKQLFKALELMGFDKEVKHIPYDFVTLKDGAMSSRQGNVVLYEDLRDKVTLAIESETRKRHPEWPEDRLKDTAKKIMISALKFGMLKFDNNRTIVFDMDEWLSFEGETGPYIEYTHARINSILKKYGQELNISNVNFEMLKEGNELNLIKLISRYYEVTEESAAQFKPSIIARYLLDLAQKFNEFYHANPILTSDEETKKARLFLILCVQQVLKSGLNLLGIEAIDEM